MIKCYINEIDPSISPLFLFKACQLLDLYFKGNFFLEPSLYGKLQTLVNNIR